MRSGHPYVKPYAPMRTNPEAEPSYDEQCRIWARGLTEYQLRQLASDYLRGERDDDCRHAYEEYQRRGLDR